MLLNSRLFGRLYEDGSLRVLPFCSPTIDFPVGVVGRLNHQVARIPHVVHDCGCGISVMQMRKKPSAEQLDEIASIYSSTYVDEELEALLPKEATLPLKHEWRHYAKQPSADDEHQKRRVYFCEQMELFAMRYHYSHHDSCDRTLQYLLDRFGETAEGADADFVFNLVGVLQEYSVRARAHYVTQIAKVVEIDNAFDCPHVYLDTDGVYRFGVQRGENVVQTTGKHLWLFDGGKSPENYGCSVGSLPGRTHLLDYEAFFNEFCEKTQHLATLREAYVVCS